MEKDISGYTTEALFEKAEREDEDHELRFKAEKLLLKRWRLGSDLEFLVDLMRSKTSSDRLRGAFYLGELGKAIEILKGPAIQFANDPLSDCRRAFVGYMASSGYYDKTIASALAKCLLDLDLYVRVETIRWAVDTSAERFEEFSRLVESGAYGLEPRFSNSLSIDFWNDSIQKRAIRGLNIVCRIRAGEEIQKIRKEFPEEDNFVLDSILFSVTSRERYLEWRKIKSQP